MKRFHVHVHVNDLCKNIAFYSAMFESGIPVDLNPTLMAASERAFAIIRAAAERLAAMAPIVFHGQLLRAQ